MSTLTTYEAFSSDISERVLPRYKIAGDQECAQDIMTVDIQHRAEIPVLAALACGGVVLIRFV